MARQGHLTTWLCVITVAGAMRGRAIQAFGPEPVCPWDCGQPSDKQVGIVDFLTLLAQWDMIGTSCDLDGAGVGITDFLLLLANWGPCPAPPNDECLDKIIIDRFNSPGTIEEQFDMSGATPSPETSPCTGVDPNPFKDIWYCLQNSTGESKIVTLTSRVDLLAEVTAGCTCPAGALVTCGRLAGDITTFTMQAGDAVCIRLINDLDLPNDQIEGTLTITNDPAVQLFDTCFDQPPNQVNGIFSDLDCDFCVGGEGPPSMQVVADQLVLVSPESIHAVKFWGGYFPGDAGGGEPLPDDFTVKFRLNDDSGGIDVPGAVIRKAKAGPATTRVETGMTLFGVREFEYTIQLASNLDLLPGDYWVEIYNDTTPDPIGDTWFWETGLLDPVNGLPGSAFSGDPPNLPGETWTIDAVQNLALNISCISPPTNVNFHTDPVEFADALLQAEKLPQFTWDFSPNILPAASVVLLDDPLDIDTHGSDPDDPWGALWPSAVDSIQFTSNMNPAGPLAPMGIDGLAFKTAGFLNLINDMLGATTLTASFDIISGAPDPATYTAMSMNLISQALVGSPVAVLFHVTVYDEQDQVLGVIDIPAIDNEKVFLGVITKDHVPIGRVDIWDVLGNGATNGAEGISSITAYVFVDVCDDCSDGSLDQCNGDPTCHECETPAGDCLCVQGTPCIFAEPCPAETCPPGFFCCTNACCGLPICLPLCGSPLAAELPAFVTPDELFSGGAAYESE